MLAVLKSDLGTWKALVVSVSCRYDLVFKSSSRDSGACCADACMRVCDSSAWEMGRRMDSLRLTWAIHWIQIQHKPWVWYLAPDRKRRRKEGRESWELWVATLTCVTGWVTELWCSSTRTWVSRQRTTAVLWNDQYRPNVWCPLEFYFFGENGK